MKVLQVVHQFFPQCHSGTEQYCLAVARASRRAGNDVRILSLDPWSWLDDPALYWHDDEPYDGFEVPRLRWWEQLVPNEEIRDHHSPLVAARIGRALDEMRPDVVHVFHLRRLGADVLRVAEERRRRGVVGRIVVHLMDFWYLCPRFTLLRSDGSLCLGPPDGGFGCLPCHAPDLAAEVSGADPATRDAARAFVRGAAAPRARDDGPAATAVAIVRRKDELLGLLERVADAVVAPSRFLRDVFVRNGFPEGRIAVIPYGLEPGRVERLPAQRPRSPLRVGFAGVLSPWKAPHVAVDAVRRRPRLAVELTVHGRLDEPTFAGYIADLRERAGDDPRIRFADAFRHEELSRVLADLDLLVVPSTWHENTPFVILEAFAAGVPVAASRLGGMAEIVRPGVDGFLFEAGNAEELATLLELLAAEPAELAALRPRAPGPVDDDFVRIGALYRGAPDPGPARDS